MPLRVFPVADPPGATFTDDWMAPRTNPDGTTRSHKGNDLFAPDGTPVLAPDDGNVRYATDPIGGQSFYLKADDGTTYYGTHLSAYEGGARRVGAGETIAYVGHGGNAAGTPPHLHFEVHPGGGAAIDPFPELQAAQRQPASKGGSPSTLRGLLVVFGVLGAGGYLYLRAHPGALRRLKGAFT